MVNHSHCAVPGCLSSSKNNPLKYFFPVPFEINERKRWFRAMGRASDLDGKTHLDICEDHFNPFLLELEEDLENYVKFKYTNGRTKIKRGVVPHIFHCIPSHEAALSSHSYVGLKRPRQPTLEDILIANKLLKESVDSDDSQDVLKLPPFYVYDQRLEEEAAETLLLLSRDIRNG